MYGPALGRSHWDVSGVGLEEVKGQGWVVDDEAGPQGSVYDRDDH